jgi:signal transduction histidine kinase
LLLELTDDGRGPGPAMDGRGRGMQGMRQRAEQLHGSIRWTVGTAGGTKVLLSLPLDPLGPGQQPPDCP